jgi:hypothetical protein
MKKEKFRQGWISVEERLPEKLIDVLTFSEKENEYFIDKLTGEGYWEFGTDEHGKPLVTHWQPLPTPPQSK